MTVDKCTASVIRVVSNAMNELPLDAIKDKFTVSEYELTTTYFHPILPRILANPDKKILLRWANVEVDESCNRRPDAVISMYEQLSFGSSLGFGEAKIAQPRTNNHDLCHDLLRLTMFCKETIDKNYLTGCISFQIHGFTIIFYLMQLQHDGIYTMLEITRLAFPRSLAELSTFVSLKNLVSLMQVSDVFWRICQPCLDEDRSQLISSRRPSHPDIHKLIDSTKKNTILGLYFATYSNTSEINTGIDVVFALVVVPITMARLPFWNQGLELFMHWAKSELPRCFDRAG